MNENVELNTAVGHAVTATDADDDELKYTLSGTDAASFAIDDAEMGQLSTKAKLNYEAKAEYRVIVTATDNSQTGSKSASIEVTISVMDLDEKPTISSGAVAITGPTRHTVPEGMTDVGTYAVSGGDGETGTLRLTGTDAGDFRINNGVVTFRSAPDYESPDDSGRDNSYVFTVSATVGGEPVTRNVTVSVTNVDEDGVLVITPSTLGVGRVLTAILTDPDGGVTDQAWQWARQTTGGVSTDIAGATFKTYTVMDEDVGQYVEVRVTYTDNYASRRTLGAITDSVVEAGEPQTVLQEYDTDVSGQVEKLEYLAALDLFLDGDIEKPELLEVLDLHLDSLL